MITINRFPVVQHYAPDPPSALVVHADRLAAHLGRSRRDLLVRDELAGLQAATIDDAPMLHLDDQSDTRLLEDARDIRFRQDIARLRAGEGDLVGACIPSADGFEEYCRDRLQLGSVRWLQPTEPEDPMHVAAALWRHPGTRQALVETARNSGRLQIDPYKGTNAVWQLALLIKKRSQGDVCVIAPPPELTAWVNNKIEFAETVRQLFSSRFTPRTLQAGNLAKAAQLVQELAESSEKIVLKLPDSVGGGGNVVVAAERFRGRSMREARAELQSVFQDLDWDGECELLVGEWETGIVTAPSVQIWIPPGEESPVVEGLFEQAFADERGLFVGIRRAALPPAIEQEIVDRAWLLARLFQKLGYVGRCSFDLLVVDDGRGDPRLEFLECNGRWGAASVPMTLMTRLFEDWTARPYAVQNYAKLGLEELSFSELLESLGDEVFDARTGRGRWILANPARMQARGGIGAIVLDEDWDTAAEVATSQFPQRLREIGRTPVVAQRP